MILESVGGDDEDFRGLNENLTSNSSNVESMHLQCDNDLVKNDELHLATIVAQAQRWKRDNRDSICWGFFVVNDNFPIDLKNP